MISREARIVLFIVFSLSFPRCSVISSVKAQCDDCTSVVTSCHGNANSVSGTPGSTCTCSCKAEYTGTKCDGCATSYGGYPTCVINSCTDISVSCNNNALSVAGAFPSCICTCKPGYSGLTCDSCATGYTGYPTCQDACTAPAVSCNGNAISVSVGAGGFCVCNCKVGWSGKKCEACKIGYSGPSCLLTEDCTDISISCSNNGLNAVSVVGTPGSCVCSCKPGFDGQRCGQCATGYGGYPSCVMDICVNVAVSCNNNALSVAGAPPNCNCNCKPGYTGLTCDSCATGYTGYPTCQDACTAPAVSCNGNAISVSGISPVCMCNCQVGWSGTKCQLCAEGYGDFPSCVESCLSTKVSCNGNAMSVSGSGGSCTCVCKAGFTGARCDLCSSGFTLSNGCCIDACTSTVVSCNGQATSVSGSPGSCTCVCTSAYTETTCDSCAVGYSGYPTCIDACTSNAVSCNGHADSVSGTPGSCTCVCKAAYTGTKCDSCASGYKGYPTCIDACMSTAVSCKNNAVSVAPKICKCAGVCDCTCRIGYRGERCGQCALGYKGYPNCVDACNRVSVSCNNNAVWVSGPSPTCTCKCKYGYTGSRCDQCSVGFSVYPVCVDDCTSVVVSCHDQAVSVSGAAGNCDCVCKAGFSGKRCGTTDTLSVTSTLTVSQSPTATMTATDTESYTPSITVTNTVTSTYSVTQSISRLTLSLTITPPSTPTLTTSLSNFAQVHVKEFFINIGQVRGQQKNAKIVQSLTDQRHVLVVYEAPDRFSATEATSSFGIFAQLLDAVGNPLTASPIHISKFYTNDEQIDVDVIALQQGGFFVCWTTHGGRDGQNGSAVFGQILDNNGDLIGVDFQINSAASGNQQKCSLAQRSDPLLEGGVVIAAWESWENSMFNLKYQFLSPSNGSSLFPGGRERPLNAKDIYVRAQQHVQLAAALSIGNTSTSGDWVSVYEEWQLDGALSGIVVQGYNRTGEPKVNQKVLVNEYSKGNQKDPQVVALQRGGEYVVIWVSDTQDSPDSSAGIYGRVFGNDLQPLTPEFPVHGKTSSMLNSQNSPTVAALEDGSFVVIWQSTSPSTMDTYRTSVVGQQFNKFGSAVGSAFLVARTLVGAQQKPSVAFLNLHRYMVVWEGPDGRRSGILGRVVDVSSTRSISHSISQPTLSLLPTSTWSMLPTATTSQTLTLSATLSTPISHSVSHALTMTSTPSFSETKQIITASVSKTISMPTPSLSFHSHSPTTSHMETLSETGVKTSSWTVTASTSTTPTISVPFPMPSLSFHTQPPFISLHRLLSGYSVKLLVLIDKKHEWDAPTVIENYVHKTFCTKCHFIFFSLLSAGELDEFHNVHAVLPSTSNIIGTLLPSWIDTLLTNRTVRCMNRTHLEIVFKPPSVRIALPRIVPEFSLFSIMLEETCVFGLSTAFGIPTKQKLMSLKLDVSLVNDQPEAPTAVSAALLKKTEETSIAASAASVMVGNPAIAAQAQRLAVLINLAGCNGDLQDGLDFIEHPLRVGFGANEAFAPYLGATWMNTALVFGCGFLQILAAVIWGAIKKKSFLFALADTRFPGALTPLLMFLYQPAVSKGVTVLISSTNAEVSIGMKMGVLCALLPWFFLPFIVAFFFRKIWRANRTRVIEKPYADCATKAKVFLNGHSKWETVEEDKDDRFPFVRLFGLGFVDFCERAPWFITVEFSMELTLGIIQGILPKTRGLCSALASCAFLIYFAYFYLLSRYRPYHTAFALWIMIPATGIQAIGSLAVMLYVFTQKEWLLVVGTIFPLITMYAMLGKAFFDTLMAILEGVMRVLQYLTKNPSRYHIFLLDRRELDSMYVKEYDDDEKVRKEVMFDETLQEPLLFVEDPFSATSRKSMETTEMAEVSAGEGQEELFLFEGIGETTKEKWNSDLHQWEVKKDETRLRAVENVLASLPPALPLSGHTRRQIAVEASSPRLVNNYFKPRLPHEEMVFGGGQRTSAKPKSQQGGYQVLPSTWSPLDL